MCGGSGHGAARTGAGSKEQVVSMAAASASHLARGRAARRGQGNRAGPAERDRGERICTALLGFAHRVAVGWHWQGWRRREAWEAPILTPPAEARGAYLKPEA